MRVVLIGFMGAGKSTTGALLADSLKVPFFEMDDWILRTAGAGSITQIFNELGEEAFRDFETSAAQYAGKLDDAVISTGGGVISRPQNLAALSDGGGRVVYLAASFDKLKERVLQTGCDRPLFSDEHAALALFEQREPLYRHYADFAVITDNKTAEEVRAEILAALRDE